MEKDQDDTAKHELKLRNILQRQTRYGVRLDRAVDAHVAFDNLELDVLQQQLESTKATYAAEQYRAQEAADHVSLFLRPRSQSANGIPE